MKSEEVEDSPGKSTNGKNKRDKSWSQTSGDSSSAKPAPKYALLESLGARFSLQEEERKRRIAAKRDRMEMEVVHSQYLRHHVADPDELETAGLVANIWAHKHGTVERVTNKLARKRSKGNCSNNALDPPFPSPAKKISSDSASGPSGRRQSASDSCILISDTSQNACWSESTPGHYQCPVRNCGCVLSCREELQFHLSHSSHSPCNPCRYMPQCKLPSYPLCHMCPYCEDPAKMRVDVAEHMVMSNHLPVFSPIAVIAFICPECLNLFPDCVDCHKHIQDCGHKAVAIPFSGVTFALYGMYDLCLFWMTWTNSLPGRSRLCHNTSGYRAGLRLQGTLCCCPLHLTCDTCQRLLTGPEEVEEHLEATSGTHVISSHASRTQVDILLEYFASGKMCTECQQIMQEGSELMEGVHKCAPGMFGIIDHLHCPSFHNFIRRCSFFYSERKNQGLVVNEEPVPISRECGRLSSSSSDSSQNALPLASPACSSDKLLVGAPLRVLSLKETYSLTNESTNAHFTSNESLPGECDLSNRGVSSSSSQSSSTASSESAFAASGPHSRAVCPEYGPQAVSTNVHSNEDLSASKGDNFTIASSSTQSQELSTRETVDTFSRSLPLTQSQNFSSSRTELASQTSHLINNQDITSRKRVEFAPKNSSSVMTRKTGSMGVAGFGSQSSPHSALSRNVAVSSTTVASGGSWHLNSASREQAGASAQQPFKSSSRLSDACSSLAVHLDSWTKPVQRATQQFEDCGSPEILYKSGNVDKKDNIMSVSSGSVHFDSAKQSSIKGMDAASKQMKRLESEAMRGPSKSHASHAASASVVSKKQVSRPQRKTLSTSNALLLSDWRHSNETLGNQKDHLLTKKMSAKPDGRVTEYMSIRSSKLKSLTCLDQKPAAVMPGRTFISEVCLPRGVMSKAQTRAAAAAAAAETPKERSRENSPLVYQGASACTSNVSLTYTNNMDKFQRQPASLDSKNATIFRLTSAPGSQGSVAVNDDKPKSLPPVQNRIASATGSQGSVPVNDDKPKSLPPAQNRIASATLRMTGGPGKQGSVNKMLELAGSLRKQAVVNKISGLSGGPSSTKNSAASRTLSRRRKLTSWSEKFFSTSIPRPDPYTKESNPTKCEKEALSAVQMPAAPSKTPEKLKAVVAPGILKTGTGTVAFHHIIYDPLKKQQSNPEEAEQQGTPVETRTPRVSKWLAKPSIAEIIAEKAKSHPGSQIRLHPPHPSEISWPQKRRVRISEDTVSTSIGKRESPCIRPSPLTNFPPPKSSELLSSMMKARKMWSLPMRKLTQGLDANNGGTKLLKRRLSYLLPLRYPSPVFDTKLFMEDSIEINQLMEETFLLPSFSQKIPMLSVSRKREPCLRKKPQKKSLTPRSAPGSRLVPGEPLFLKLKDCEKGIAYLSASKRKFQTSLNKLKKEKKLHCLDNLGFVSYGYPGGNFFEQGSSHEGCQGEVMHKHILPISRAKPAAVKASCSPVLQLATPEVAGKLDEKTMVSNITGKENGHKYSQHEDHTPSESVYDHGFGTYENTLAIEMSGGIRATQDQDDSMLVKSGNASNHSNSSPAPSSSDVHGEQDILPPNKEVTEGHQHEIDHFSSNATEDATTACSELTQTLQTTSPVVSYVPCAHSSKDTLPSCSHPSHLPSRSKSKDSSEATAQLSCSDGSDEFPPEDNPASYISAGDSEDEVQASRHLNKRQKTSGSKTNVGGGKRKKKHVTVSIVKRCVSSTLTPKQRKRQRQMLLVRKELEHLIYEPSPSFLLEMNHIIFLDLENFPNFFQRLLHPLPDSTFVWAFKSTRTSWKMPDESCEAFQYLRDKDCFSMSSRVFGKNSADFAIFFTVGRMDTELPKSIPFSVVSQDKAFQNLPRLLAESERSIRVVDPHLEISIAPERLHQKISAFSRNAGQGTSDDFDLISNDMFP